MWSLTGVLLAKTNPTPSAAETLPTKQKKKKRRKRKRTRERMKDGRRVEKRREESRGER